MTASNAKQLTEDEADAALFALAGPQLEWYDFGNYLYCWAVYARYGLSRKRFGVRYNVWQVKKLGFFHSHFEVQALYQPFDEEFVTYKQLAEAKAACERHFATEKWE